jgi:hypothetical protein
MERDAGITSSVAMLSVSDAKSINLLTKILGAEFDSQALQSETGLTTKALYIRLTRFLRAGIVTRRNGKYSLTSFGKIVYHAQDLIAIALSNYWRLSALDSLTMLHGLPIAEYNKICERLLSDQRIKKTLSHAGQTENNHLAVCMNEIFIKTQRSKKHKEEFGEI